MIDKLPTGSARELHGREALLALESHFEWRDRHPRWLHDLWVEQRELELQITQPAPLGAPELALVDVDALDEPGRWAAALGA